VRGPFFSTISTIARDIGLGLQILFKRAFRQADPVLCSF
jgi:hypothetical protein